MTKRAVILLLALTLLIFTANAFARQVSDEIGRAVEIPESLNRIVSLTPSLTETLFALGLGNRLVGVTTWSNYPEKAKDIPKVGTYVSPSLETIVALRPDLVIADKVCNPPSVVHSLEAGGMPVYVVNSEDPFDLPKQFLRLGEICGAPEKARLMAQDMERQWTDLADKVRDATPVRTLVVIGYNPLISAGEKTLLGKLLSMLKGDNIAAGAPGRWPKISMEYVVNSKPELVVLTVMEIDADIREQIRVWETMPGLKDQPGYRVEVIESDLINRPGPRLTEGAEALARVLHPKLFDLKAQPK